MVHPLASCIGRDSSETFSYRQSLIRKGERQWISGEVEFVVKVDETIYCVFACYYETNSQTSGSTTVRNHDIIDEVQDRSGSNFVKADFKKQLCRV